MLFYRKVLLNTPKNKAKLDKMPKIYIVAKWIGFGIQEFYFAKYDADGIPQVYQYNDHNGTADQYELVDIYNTTTGSIYSWTFNKEAAEHQAHIMNEFYKIQYEDRVKYEKEMEARL
jgi:hypothetical protein